MAFLEDHAEVLKEYTGKQIEKSSNLLIDNRDKIEKNLQDISELSKVIKSNSLKT